MKSSTTHLMYPELSYKLRGIFFEVCNEYGLCHKEKLYHEAITDHLKTHNLIYVHEKQLPIFSHRDGRRIGVYIPDFIIENKIILEIKSTPFIIPNFINQVYSYLRNSLYELAFIVNFGEEKILIRRLLFTNDRKPYQVKNKPVLRVEQ